MKITVELPGTLIELLHKETDLPKARIKDALNKGALSLKRPGNKSRRIRKAKASLYPGDFLQFCYDPAILNRNVAPPQLVYDAKRYSCWNKPAGLLSQGTKFGDHCSVLRKVELHFNRKRQVFLVHRLDREAEGLICVAHDKNAAAALSKLFTEEKIEKKYMVEVKGDLVCREQQKEITLQLDGKEARTVYKQIAYSPEKDTSIAVVRIHSGRMHQIRRHFDAIDHPVIGDPRYGTDNCNQDGMRLRAVGLKFICPFSKKTIDLMIDGF